MGIEDRRAREFQRREADILSAALSLAGTEDWPAVTIDLIAEKAEIGKGTVYKHFKSKDEVCARLVANSARDLLAKLKAMDPGMEYVPRLKEALKIEWRHFRAHPELASLGQYCDVSGNSLVLGDEAAREYWGMKDQILAFMQGLLEEGIARGILADQPHAYMMVAGWSTMIGAKRLVLEMEFYPGMVDDEAFLDYLVDFVLKGLMNAQVPSRAN